MPVKKHHNMYILLTMDTALPSLSDGSIPVRFKAHQRAKSSSLQLTAVCIWNAVGNHQPWRRNFHVTEAPFIRLSMLTACKFSKSCNFPGSVQMFSAHTSTLMTESELTIPAFCPRFVDVEVQVSFRLYLCPRQVTLDSKRGAAFRPFQVWRCHDFPEPITICCAEQPMRLLHFVRFVTCHWVEAGLSG